MGGHVWSPRATARFKGGGVLVPGRDLFLPGDILLDYDSADLDTMFQDANGTTPVTADGQSVALHLDKGKWGGLSYAAMRASQPELVAAGDGVVTTGWSAPNGGSFVSSGGEYIFTSAASVVGIDDRRSGYAITCVVGRTYSVQCSARVVTSAILVLNASSNLNTTAGSLATTTSTTAVPLKAHFVATATTMYIQFRHGTDGSAQSAIDNVSVREIPGYPRRQSVGASQRKYKTDGVLRWTLNDGSDDSDLTDSINWGTDEVALSVALRKNSDAATGFFTEFSYTTASNAGAFYLAAPVGAAAIFQSQVNGAAYTTAATGASYAAPITAVVGLLAKIATDTHELWVNDVLAASQSGDLGSGNFGNYPLYFGRRFNSNFPYNGAEFRTLARNRLWTSQERPRVSRFLAGVAGISI